MSLSISTLRRIVLAATVAALACTVFLEGCGNNASTESSMPTSMPSTPGPNAAPANAAPKKLKFTELTLNSDVKHVTKKGVAYAVFSYVDNDGSASKCELPEAMTKGEYTNDEWTATFSLYKLPGVVKVKVVKKKQSGTIDDFPFIAPKPQKAPSAAPQQTATPAAMPTVPAMSSSPSGSAAPGGPAGPGPMGPGRSMPMPGAPAGR